MGKAVMILTDGWCCQICTKMPGMSDLCYLGKTRVLNGEWAYSSVH